MTVIDDGSDSEQQQLLSTAENADGEDGERTGTWTVDEVLNHIGIGYYQAYTLLVLGAITMVDAGEALLLSFLGPDIKCEWEISSIEESCVTAAVFLGMAAGALTFGYLGDRIGRRTTAVIDVTLTALFGILSAASPNVWFLIVCRFIVGAGVGGFSLLLSMYSEFLPTKQRGTSLASFELFWGGGAVVTAGLAWLLMPDYHWRGLTVATALPLVLLLLALPFISESPRYLMVNGREEQALTVLRIMAKFNGKSLPPGLRLKNVTESEQQSCVDIATQFKRLFTYPLTQITTILWSNWLGIAVGYYSIVMLTTSVHAGNGNDQSCVDGHVVFTHDSYRDIIIDACAEIPGILFAILTVEYFGRRRMLLFMWLGSAVAMLLLPITPSLYTTFLFAGRFFSMGSFTVLMVVVPELYPSSCRSFGMGAGSLVSRAGAALSPFLAQTVYEAYGLTLVALVQGILFLLIGALTFCIPFETKGKSMKDTIDDVKKEIKGNKDEDRQISQT